MKDQRVKELNPYLKIMLTSSFSKIRAYFPNLKEVTESVGALRAYQRFYEPREAKQVVVVGDGAKPRTAALFAVSGAASLLSIDPNFRTCNTKIPKLRLIAEKVEDCQIDESIQVIICVHSHSTLSNCLKTFPKAERIISIPCCVPDEIPERFELEVSYRDENIVSPKDVVNVYRRRDL